MARHIAQIELSSEMLIAGLHFPPDTEIVGCRDGMFDGHGLGSIVIVVEHPDLPERKAGDQVPTALPMLRTLYAQPEKVVFVGWGIRQ